MSSVHAVPDSAVDVSMDVEPPLPTTLGALLETLGPHALRLASSPDPTLLANPAGEPFLHGLGEPLPDVSGALVLIAGAHPARSETFDAIRAAGQLGCAAVVLKSFNHDVSAAAAVADTCHVALLCTPDEMYWRHLDALVTAARTASITVGGQAAESRPGDLFSLANAISGSVGGAIVIEEPSGRVLAYSNLPGHEIDEIRRMAILGRQTPERPTNADEYRKVMRAAGVVRFHSSQPDYAGRLAIAVRAGHHVLGLMFVLSDRPQLSENAEQILLDASRVTALHLLRSRGEQDPDRLRRSDALQGLLHGDIDVDVARSALALSPDAPLMLAAVRLAASSQSATTDAARIADLVAVHGQYWHSQAASVASGGQVFLMLPLDDSHLGAGRSRSELVDIAHDLDLRLQRVGRTIVTAIRRSTGLDVVVGFGAVCRLADLPAGRHFADRVAATLQTAAGGESVATLQGRRTEVVLGALGQTELIQEEALLLPQVREILEHDRSEGTEYAETFLVFLETFGDAKLTAQRMNVHVNTARYRIRRLTELFGVDLREGQQTLVSWIQLQTLVRRRAAASCEGG